MNSVSIALTIAGSDSGGGAGIQADLKTFQSLGVFGTSAITCITAQNPDGVSGILEVDPGNVEKQILAVLNYFPVKSVKTGMLFSKEIISVVAKIRRARKFRLIVDPVMVATSGAQLLKDDAIETLKSDLLPIADLITPNADEASLLLGKKVNRSNINESAKELHSQFLVPVLLKGGHLEKNGTVKDVLYDGVEFFEWESEYIRNISTHGTGCTYSAAICAYLAKGQRLNNSVDNAKNYLHKTLVQSFQTGKSTSLNHNPEL